MLAKNPIIETVKRSPVICVMGHIDHGKSTLLDFIRKTNIVDNEAGGITQCISAYEVNHTSGNVTNTITFLDTPGHEAFQKMRERGANVADIAVLVVSAEDGVKKQTLEAWSAIKSANIPFVVAINKIDKPNADVEKTKLTLAENGIYLEGYGGDVSYVSISSTVGTGVNELLDILVLTADIAGLTGTKKIPAEGFVIETCRDAKKGISASLVIKNGELEIGMCIASGTHLAPVRAIDNFLGKKIQSATFSCPVLITGWDDAPIVGEKFKAYKNKKEAEKATSEARENIHRHKKTKVTETETEGKKIVPIIIKADAHGSIEAIEHELNKLKHERVIVKVVYKGIGDITESDVKTLAGGVGAVILGFNVKLDAQAKALSERLSIPVQIFDIIYKLSEWLDEHIKSNAPKISVEESVGQAKIMKFFSRTKDKQIVGGKVTKGELKIGHKVRIFRRDVLIGEGIVRELQQQKERTSSVPESFEFGACIDAKIEIAPGDIIEDFIIVEKQ